MVVVGVGCEILGDVESKAALMFSVTVRGKLQFAVFFYCPRLAHSTSSLLRELFDYLPSSTRGIQLRQ